MVALAAITDLRAASARGVCGDAVSQLLAGPAESRDARFADTSPIELLPHGLPQRLVCGASDRLVPNELSSRYAEAARNAGDPATLEVVEGAGHFELVDPASPAVALGPAARSPISVTGPSCCVDRARPAAIGFGRFQEDSHGPPDRPQGFHAPRHGGGAAVSLSLAGPLTRQVLGANDRVRVGAIGTGRQGLSNMKAFQRHGAEIAAVCDVFEPNLAKARTLAASAAAAHSDFRRVLDDKTIDVVIVATPDHWHALPAVQACEAGKDVFVEKPVSVAVEEGKAMLAAARKHQRVMQVALWQRSNAHFQRAAQVVRSGLLGKVTSVRAWNYSNASPDGIGNPPDSDAARGARLGRLARPRSESPLQRQPLRRGDDRWSTFRYFWDYSNGILGDWGVHLIDIAQWALDTPGPRVVSCFGQKQALRDNGDSPDTLTATFEYPDFLLTYEYRATNANSMFAKGYGLLFHGTEATMFLNRQGFEVFPETRKGKDTRTSRAPRR